MKIIGLSICMLIIWSSCSPRKSNNANESDIIPENKDSFSSAENAVYLNFKRINNSIEITQTASEKIRIPAPMMDLLKISFTSCEDCYDLGNFSDTTLTLDLNKEYSVSGFNLMDINFDGKIDIRFPSESSCCLGNNVTFETWLNKGNIFVYQAELSEMPVWNVEKDSKTISGGWQMGAFDYVSSVYTLKNDSLILIKEESSETVQDTMVKVIHRKLVDNKWVCDSSLSKI